MASLLEPSSILWQPRLELGVPSLCGAASAGAHLLRITPFCEEVGSHRSGTRPVL